MANVNAVSLGGNGGRTVSSTTVVSKGTVINPGQKTTTVSKQPATGTSTNISKGTISSTATNIAKSTGCAISSSVSKAQTAVSGLKNKVDSTGNVIKTSSSGCASNVNKSKQTISSGCNVMKSTGCNVIRSTGCGASATISKTKGVTTTGCNTIKTTGCSTIAAKKENLFTSKGKQLSEKAKTFIKGTAIGGVAGAATGAIKKTLLISKPQIEENIQKLKAAKSNIDSTWKDLKNSHIKTLEQSWVGKDAKKYLEETLKYDKKIEVVEQVLDMLANKYKETLNKVDEVEQRVESTITNLGSGGGGSSSF